MIGGNASRVARASGPLLRNCAIGPNDEVTFRFVELCFRTAELTDRVARAIGTVGDGTGCMVHTGFEALPTGTVEALS